MIDTALINSVKKREHDAFKRMYKCCIRYVYAIVRRYVSNESDHQDVIQEIFAKVFLSIDTYNDSKGEFKFWLRRLTINQCLQHYRQGKSPRQMISIEAVAEPEINIEKALNAMTRAEVEQYLERMPDGYRQVFMLVIIDEYSHKEVGELLGISPETSRSQLSRAKSWLRKKILGSNKQKHIALGI